jgi:HEAT repeat protein
MPASSGTFTPPAPVASATPAPAAQGTIEPDRRGDSLSHPRSERLPRPAEGWREIPALQAALSGPDSALARRLYASLSRVPRGEEDLVRERAAWALARAQGGRLVEPLIEALADPDWRVQAYAAWALAMARDPRAVPTLLPLASHSVWRLRAAAVNALVDIGDPRARPAMVGALGDDAWQVRVNAVRYLGQHGDRSDVDLLRPRLRDRHMAVRHEAEEAVARLGALPR